MACGVAVLVAGATPAFADGVGFTSVYRGAQDNTHLRLAASSQAASGPLRDALPANVEAGSVSKPVRAGVGYHFELLNGSREGSTKESVVVKKGDHTVGYIDNASLIAGNSRLVSAQWRVNETQLILDARSVARKEGTLRSYLAFSTARPAAGGMPTLNYGFVSVPSNYVYNPKLGSLHDYCTKSPDSFGSANFRGPCARHDLCFASANRLSGWSKIKAKQSCNNALHSNMIANCDVAYSWYNPARKVCYDMAHAYWVAVTSVNP